MFHLQPIPVKDAPESIGRIYEQIKESFEIDTVPLFFQYLANYDKYFGFIWQRMQSNLVSEVFRDLCSHVKVQAKQSVIGLETPSPFLFHFIQTINPSEQTQIFQIVQELENTNASLCLLTLGVRESIKGIYISTQVSHKIPENNRDAAIPGLQTQFRSTEQTYQANQLLAPLLGSNSLMVSNYADFFTHIAVEMETLQKTAAYLNERVELEHLGLTSIIQFAQPLDCSYSEFRQLTEGQRYIDELLYLLTDTFPSQFPHLVLTTAVMQKALEKNKEASLTT